MLLLPLWSLFAVALAVVSNRISAQPPWTAAAVYDYEDDVEHLIEYDLNEAISIASERGRAKNWQVCFRMPSRRKCTDFLATCLFPDSTTNKYYWQTVRKVNTILTPIVIFRTERITMAHHVDDGEIGSYGRMRLVSPYTAQKFILAQHRITCPITIFGQNVYNWHLSVCDLPENTFCYPRDDDCEPSPPPPPPPPPPPTSTSSTTTTTTRPTGPCAAMEDPNEDENVPDPTDCSRYIFCSNGTYVKTVDCPPGLLFETTEEMCDVPDNVNCGDRPSPLPTTNSTTTTKKAATTTTAKVTTTTTTTTTTESSPLPPGPCAVMEDPNEDENVPDPNDCSRYVFCSNGTAVRTIDCPSGLLFEPTEEMCDVPENVNCGDRPIPPPQN